jgi:hypothetical protein
MEGWLKAHTRKGARCSECSATFTADRGDGKRIAIFPNGAGGLALYVLCKSCGAKYEMDRQLAIPNVWKDCRVTALMSPYAALAAPTLLQ